MLVQTPSYRPPVSWVTTNAQTLLEGMARALVLGSAPPSLVGTPIFAAGDPVLLKKPCVAVIGSRRVSEDGAARARRVARELAHAQIVVVSGLAEGVDIEAMRSATAEGGKVVGVIGTPLDTAYPAQHGTFQEKVHKDHLLVSQFAVGARVSPKNFPARNQLMALLSDATIIVEAADNSGALHQAAACVRFSRWLFIVRSVAENTTLTWPAKYRPYGKCVVIDRIEDALERL